MRKYLFITAVLTLVLYACSSDSGSDNPPEPEPVNFERGPMLINWTDNIIIPGYIEFSAQLTDLSASFEIFSSDPTEINLQALRRAWLSAYKTWQRVDMFEIGPAETAGLRLGINTYPSDTEKIELNATGGSYDLTLPSNRDAKGFPALDYLINGLGSSDADIIAILGDASASDTYLVYIDALIADMQSLSGQVLEDWQQGYRDTFVNNDGASATASVDRFVNDYIFYYEKFLRAGKMGIPLGVFSGGALPGNLEAYHAHETVSNDLFLVGLQATQDFFNGKHFDGSQNGESLATYLDALNTVKNGEDLNKIINDQFNTARAEVTGLGSFRTEIEGNNPPTDMLMAYDEVQRAVPLLKVDMVSAMSISIDFVDADGD